MKRIVGNRLGTPLRLAVFLLAFLMLAPQILAAPGEPEVELTHTGDGDRVVLTCTAKVAPPDGESDYRVAMTLTIQADKSMTIDPSSVQAIYQSEDGETTTLDQDHSTADQAEGLVVTALEVDTDMGGQIQCRVSARMASSGQGKATNTARLDVEYQDLVSGDMTALRATDSDSLTVTQAYSLTLDLNGGTLAGKNGNYVWRADLSAGEQVNLADLPKPTRSGYFFDGWTLSSGTGAKLGSNSLTMGSGSATLRAVWTSMADQLTLDRNGGSGRQVTIAGTTGQDVTLPYPSEVLYSRDGYKLGGWCTTPDGTGTIYRGGESFPLTRGEDVLYAWWAPQYTLAYDANGGKGNMPRRIFAASDQAVISENAFTRSGYKFTGWCLSADGRGTLYQSGDSLTLTGDTTLYAQWEKVYETPAETPGGDGGGGSHLPLLLGILAALAVIGGICGYLVWKRRRDEDDPYDDGYDGDPYDEGYDRDYGDEYEDEYGRRDRYDEREYRPRDRYDRRDSRYDDREGRYRDRNTSGHRHNDRYEDRDDWLD